MRISHSLAVIAASLALGGCASTFNTAGSSEFSCPGMPNGVVCAAPFTAYEMTNGSSAALDQQFADPEQQRKAGGVPAARLDAGGGVLGAGVATALAGRLPQPIMEQAQVMRIWVAPWVDANNDVHWPSYIYTEIQPKRWRFGLPATRQSAGVIPHLADAPVALPTAAPKGAENVGAQGHGAAVAEAIPMNQDAALSDVPSI